MTPCEEALGHNTERKVPFNKKETRQDWAPGARPSASAGWKGFSYLPKQHLILN